MAPSGLVPSPERVPGGSTLCAAWFPRATPSLSAVSGGPVAVEGRHKSTAQSKLNLSRRCRVLATIPCGFRPTKQNQEVHRVCCIVGATQKDVQRLISMLSLNAGKHARVSTNVMLRDLDLLPQDRPDTRRLEVVADGLPLHNGAHLAIDTTMVSPL